ncbi:MAG: hypothetical protein ABW208_08875 [Pyrinomonadaceae bacterium]
MLNINPERLQTTAHEAFNRAQGSCRWQSAITRALQLLRDSVYWHPTADGALLILSPDSSEIYEASGQRCDRIDGERRVACKAFAQNQPCKHRAAWKLLQRYNEDRGQ